MTAETAVHNGRCHCGNIQVSFETARRPEELHPRICGCSFCRRQGARYASDPQGRVRFEVRDPERLTRYRFGHKTADFLLCATCGVYFGAVMTEGGMRYAVLNVDVFDEPVAIADTPQSFDYDAEDEADRVARRKARWTPVETIVEGSS